MHSTAPLNPRPSDSTVSFVDGVTYTIAQVGSKVVVGGTFTQVGPGQRGAAGVVNVAGSTFGNSFPDVAGAVYAAAPDGSGGWYLAGDFPTVGGSARADLAQVDSTGTLTAWAPAANGAVRTIAVGSDGIYVGGDFTTINGSAAGGLAKVDASTGSLLWNGSALAAASARSCSAATGARSTPPACSPRSAARHVPGSARSLPPPARSTPRSCLAPPTRTSTPSGSRAPRSGSPATSPRSTASPATGSRRSTARPAPSTR